jgi:hypothetical protein
VPRRSTGIGFLLICIWAAFALTLGQVQRHNEFLIWALAGGGVLIAIHLCARASYRDQDWNNLKVAAAMPVAVMVMGFAVKWVSSLTRSTYDALLLRYDFGISAAIRVWTLSMPVVYEAVLHAYDAPPMFVLLGVASLKGAARKRLILASVLGGVLCAPCYLLFPAVGPVHVGQLGAPINCMPSMHMTWALLLLVDTRGLTRWAFAAVAVLTAWSTLATGEHYVLDLVVAVPWTWLLVFLSRRLTRNPQSQDEMLSGSFS